VNGMSGSCCSRSGPMSPALLDQLKTKLGLIESSLPDPVVLCLCNSDGEVITELGQFVHSHDSQGGRRKGDNSRLSQGAFAHVLSALRVAAVRFANTLQVTECPVIHIKGAEYLFSCYIVSSFVSCFCRCCKPILTRAT